MASRAVHDLERFLWILCSCTGFDMNKAASGMSRTPASPVAVASGFEPGDRILDFVRIDETGQPQAFYEYPKGRLVILAIVAKLPAKAAVWASLQALSNQFTEHADCCVLAVVPQSVEANAALKADLELGCSLWSDDGTITDALTHGPTQTAFRVLVLDANLRIRSAFPNKKVKSTPDSLCQAVASATSALRPAASPQHIHRQAPVLLVPDILDGTLCKQLIKAHDQGKTFASGMVRHIDGERQMRQEGNTKRRVDHLVESPELTQTVTNILARRLLPEMKKAFHFEPGNLEGLKIVRYDGKEQGFFGLHRDNNTREVARRRFALTLNLNSPSTYKGGALRFPEYGSALYRPAQGEALVFSCSHLHEVTPVTQGSRYVLITFFLR